MPISDARKRANRKYNDAHYEKVHFDAPIGFKEQVRAAAQASGVSPSQYMRDAVLQRVEADAAKVDDASGQSDRI